MRHNRLAVFCTGIVLALTIGGCGGNNNNDNTSTPSPEATSTPVATSTPTPSPTPVLSFEQISAPAGLEQIVIASNGTLFARSQTALYANTNNTQWQNISIAAGFSNTYDIDTDNDSLYISDGTCYIALNIETLRWADRWQCPCSWDQCVDIEFTNGIGWCACDKWGYHSGPQRSTSANDWQLKRGDMPFADIDLTSINSDPIDPANIAYATGHGHPYITIDGGEHWTLDTHGVIAMFTIQGAAYAFSSCDYSNDHGTTWKPIGLCGVNSMAQTSNGTLFASVSADGIFSGQPSNWMYAGLQGHQTVSLAASQTYLFALDTDGNLYQAPL
jgi:hypothetical protein